MRTVRLVDKWGNIRNELFRIIENNILIREHPCALIDQKRKEKEKKITIVLISFLR